MLVLRIKDPALGELDNKIAMRRREYLHFLKKAESDPSFLEHAESAYKDMNALLELRSRSAAKHQQETTG